MTAKLQLRKKKLDGHRDQLILEILRALKAVNGWGSVEIFIQNFKVTQITQRQIKKSEYQLE